MRALARAALAAVLLLGAATAVAQPGEGAALPELVVEADRLPPGTAPGASVRVLDRATLDAAPVLTVDDALLPVPGFQLFRRQSSLVANPTSQGVSLRGLGASGTSRTLVLLDGVPLNDPFGGWVPWNRVSLEGLERIDVIRGPAAAPWGNLAMGGVVSLVTARPESRAGGAVVEGGTHDTVRADGWATDRQGSVGLGVGGGWLATGGWPIVRADQRGAIDVPAGSARGVLDTRAEWTPPEGARFHARANLFDETRDNGTPLTGNDSRAADVAAGVRWRAFGGDGAVQAFGKLGRFASTFSSQGADRRSEQPASDQFDVPSSAAGAAATWWGAAGPHAIGAGTDVYWIDGASNEDGRFVDGRFTRRRAAGSEELFAGAWAQGTAALHPRLAATLGLRLDGWRTANGFRRERDLTAGAALRDDALPSRHAVLASPSLLVRWTLDDGWALRGGASRGWRAPTVNELVRGFRVRNDVTEPNPDLDPEVLTGGEVGVERLGARWSGVVTAYWSVVDDPIANVTVGRGPGDVVPCGFVPAGGVCRQRMNLGRSRVRGVEAEGEVALWRELHLTLGGLYADAVIVDGGPAPGLDGRRPAQVPQLEGSTGLRWAPARGLQAAVQVRYGGLQYEDDGNTLPLGGYATMDVRLGWRFGRFEAFVAVDNALDRTYLVGRSADGLETIGMPLLAHGGLRARF
ncbi:MAG: TonB-dependent receptor [bacterium]|nr:TonB-dependent receptor [bacterium]